MYHFESPASNAQELLSSQQYPSLLCSLHKKRVMTAEAHPPSYPLVIVSSSDPSNMSLMSP